MQVLQEVYGIPGDRAWLAASGFGGGIGREQSVCGAVTGGVIALGLEAAGRIEDPRKVGADVMPRVRELYEGFAREFGHVECRHLIPFDFNAPGGRAAFQQSDAKQTKCTRYVTFVARTLAAGKASLPS